MMSNSLKQQAEEIITSIAEDLQQRSSMMDETGAEADGPLNALFNRLMGIVNDVDLSTTAKRVDNLRVRYPNMATEELARKLIQQKIQKTGTIGAVTSGAGLIPGVGTATALVVGTAADIGATFKLQAELVLEMAHLHHYPLTEQEKQQVVLFITGLSAGASSLARKAGQRASLKFSEVFAEKSLLKALPIIGVVASAGTNALSTYIIGQRANAYFSQETTELESWQDSLRAITGVDEREISRWLVEGSKATGQALATGADKISEAGKAAGATVAAKAEQATDLSQKAGRVYFGGVKTFWKVTFSTLIGTAKLVVQLIRSLLHRGRK